MTDSGLGILHAWVDESMHSSGPHMAHGIYLLAATLAAPGATPELKGRLRGLVVGKNDRLHWRDETTSRRRLIAAEISTFGLAHTVVIGSPLDERKQERARRVCMETLLMELSRRGVGHVWVESRKLSLDAKDVRLLDAVRNKRTVDAHLELSFARAREDPMLWAPDTVAGAVGAALKGGDAIPRAFLRTSITETPCHVR